MSCNIVNNSKCRTIQVVTQFTLNKLSNVHLILEVITKLFRLNKPKIYKHNTCASKQTLHRTPIFTVWPTPVFSVLFYVFSLNSDLLSNIHFTCIIIQGLST